jgi:hypothetical protein
MTIENPDNVYPHTEITPKGDITTWRREVLESRNRHPSTQPTPIDLDEDDTDPSDTFDTQVHY